MWGINTVNIQNLIRLLLSQKQTGKTIVQLKGENAEVEASETPKTTDIL